MPAGWQWGQSPCVQRRALGTVPEWAAGTVPVWSLPSPLRDRNVASPLLRNCGVWWAILYLTRRGRHVYGVVRSFYHRCFNRFQMSELEIDLESFAVHFALTGSGDSPQLGSGDKSPCGHSALPRGEAVSAGRRPLCEAKALAPCRF